MVKNVFEEDKKEDILEQAAKKLKQSRTKQRLLATVYDTFLSKINYHERDGMIAFDEEKHEYYKIAEGGKFRVSVTKIKEFFTGPFDQEAAIAMKFQFPVYDVNKQAIVVGKSSKAAKDPPSIGLTREECIAQMSAPRDFGTKVHAIIEAYLEDTKNDEIRKVPVDNRLEFILEDPAAVDMETRSCIRQFLYFEDFMLKNHKKPYRIEWVIFHEEYDLAGSVDAIWEYKDGGETVVDVVDWKNSSKSMKKLNDWKKPLLFYPLEHLDNNAENGYKLQLALYTVILEEKYNKKVNNNIIVKLNPVSGIYEAVTFKPLRTEAKAALSVWKSFLELESIFVKFSSHEHSLENEFLPSTTFPPYCKSIH